MASASQGPVQALAKLSKVALRISARNRVAVACLSAWSSITLLLLAGAPRKHRWSLLSLFYRSLWMALRSSHLRNMVFSAAVVSYIAGKRVKSKLAMPLSLGTLYLLYYHFSVKENACIRCQASYWNTMIVEKARLAQQPFCPTIWAINRHAQTITCLVLSMVEWLWSKPVTYVRQCIVGWDGNEQHLDWVDEVLQPQAEETRRSGQEVPSSAESRPICLLIHGLGDDRFHPALLRMARLCRNRGWRVVAWSYWRLDFSETRDLTVVVDHISQLAPQAPLMAIGWSAGGHILLNYLGTVGKSTQLVCAVALSPAFDLFTHSKLIAEEENAFYYRFLGMQAFKCMRRHVKNDRRISDPGRFMEDFRLTRVGLEPARIYDNFLAACPSDPHLSSFESVASAKAAAKSREEELAYKVFEHYPAACHNLGGIGIPTLLVYSQDDPVANLDPSSVAELERNRNIIAASTVRGGHVGFYDTFFPAGSTWDARMAAAYLGAVLEALSQTHYMLSILKEATEQGLFAGPGQNATSADAKAKAAGQAPGVVSAASRPAPAASTLRPSVMRRICSQSDVRPGAV
eukprot:TRINITY_DN29201_c0_g1_i2.p1 TRINITY_DN29201_c0_g1~~TRINITY_DN29201_c0_g1_i2.p1  ORF type:complete len:574 (+),score=91.65 TRINITY_DN29201_c0_g1_i2:40-1761(+)